jgi:broad specificity phosphatase PhoE
MNSTSDGAAGGPLDLKERLVIKLVRHGQSTENAGARAPSPGGNHLLRLTAKGRAQARAAGRKLGADFIRGAIIYCSPYRRTRETLAEILKGAGVPRAGVRGRIYEDPRLREVEHGYEDVALQQPLRERYGWFYYRYKGGESPADCFDRTSGFLESLMRQIYRKRARRVLIVAHGLTMRCFVMRYLHLTVEDFEKLDNPRNCAIYTIASGKTLKKAQFSCGRWRVTGLVPQGLRGGPAC